MEELSPTAYVILGFLGMRPMSGYEIKSSVDNSTRFFWAASYGQIYPELRALEEQGLIEGKPAPQGERPRTVYRLTREGRRRLQSWLARPAEVHELRDEALLQLFFSGARPEGAGEVLEGKRALHLEKLERLREIEPTVRASGDPFCYTVLRYGIALNEFSVRWCEQAIEDLPKGHKTKAA